MGLSGSGKSTLLRCINRLNEPTLGEVYINGENITRKSDKELQQLRRTELAMVFQHFGLLPHRTVLSNIAFGLELQGVPKVEREKKSITYCWTGRTEGVRESTGKRIVRRNATARWFGQGFSKRCISVIDG
jgi:ABC-type proline/glycine betaine transport system ATPase subunit